MNLGFYSAAHAAYSQQQRLNVIANNTANINTTGYKAEIPAFSALLYTNVNGIDGAQLARGAGTRLEKADINFEDGAIGETGRGLDYAIEGEGFFRLVDSQTGEVSYTRAGNFMLSQFGDGYFLTDITGHRFVVDQAGQRIPAVRRADGTLDSEATLPVGIFAFDQKNGILHLEGNRFAPVAKNGPERPARGRIFQNCLEQSNTNFAYELSKVIEAQRAYSYALTMVRTSDEVETTINNLRG